MESDSREKPASPHPPSPLPRPGEGGIDFMGGGLAPSTWPSPQIRIDAKRTPLPAP